MNQLLLSSIFVGFFIALPFGGNAVLCTKNTLSYGQKSGFATGLGAATAHTTYGFIGLSGLVAIKSLLSTYLGGFEIVGGLFLCYFGISSLRKDNNETDTDDVEESGMLKTYLGSTLFALTNPKSVILAGILITESGIFELVDYSQSFSLMVALSGIFLGSALWWLILVTSLGFLKKILNQMYLSLLKRAAGVLVILFGLLFSGLGFSNIWFSSHPLLSFISPGL